MKALIAACLFATVTGIATETPQPSRPNVVVILADDLGFSDLGCFGGEIETPNLDRLAAGGLRFTQFYNTSRCWPTRAALLTGYYAQQVRRDAMPGLHGGMRMTRPEWARLLPELLRPAGYRSYHSGKWHVDGKVLAAGFDRSLTTNLEGNYFTAKGNRIDDQPEPVAADESGYYTTTATIDHAIECLRDHGANHSGRPFFHYIAFNAPHFPLKALPEDIAKYRDRYLGGWDAMRSARLARQEKMGLVKTAMAPLEREVGPPHPDPDALLRLGPGEVDRPQPWVDLTPEEQRFQADKMAVHAAMVDRMDREIGRLVKQLTAMGAFENTLILFLSDNGATAEILVRGDGHDPTAPLGSEATHLCLGPGFSSACNTPFRRHKTWTHEGGISTSFIAHWPVGIADRGVLRHTPAHVIDIVPTVLELAGLAPNSEWAGKPVPAPPGRSLLPALAADVPVPRDFLWWLHEGNRAIRVGDWKLVSAAKPNGEWELYNLATDRGETTNLAAAQPDRVKDMAAKWENACAGMLRDANGSAP